MSYRQELRADRAAERAADREDRRLELEAHLKAKAEAAEQKRKDDEARDERRRKAEEARRRQEIADRKAAEAAKTAKKEAAAAKRARVRAWLKTNPATLFVAFVMVASIVPAVISQIGALSGASVNVALAALLAAMLEGGAWAVTFMGKQAEDAGRETRKYRIAGWLLAAAAASVNLWHGLEQYAAHPWVAFVLAGSSLFAFFIWDLKTHGSHGKTRAERREEKARREHLKKRRRDHKDIAREADRLKSALPYGTISDEDAFAAAWRMHKGAEPGLSAETYATATNAMVQLGAAFELGEHVRPELLRTGMLAAALNPLRAGFGSGLQTLGPTVPVNALQGPTTQFPLGIEAPATPSTQAAPKARETAPKRRTDEELERLLPNALKAAANLVAEGKQISAAALAKRLRIRREDALWLRDRVIEERKLHLVRDPNAA